MNKILIGLILTSVYVITTIFNYSVNYQLQEIENDISLYEQKINDLSIEEKLKLSREEGTNNNKLQLRNNIYYLKEE